MGLAAIVHILFKVHRVFPEFHQIVSQFALRDSQVFVADHIARRLHGYRPGIFAFLRKVGRVQFFRLRRLLCPTLPGLSLVLEAAARALQRLFLAPDRCDRGKHGVRLLVEFFGHQFHIDVAQDRIGYHSDALHDVTDNLGPAYRVALTLLEQQVALERDEILFILLDIFPDLDQGMALGKGVGIIFGRQLDHLHAETLLQHEIDTAQSRFNTSRVTIVNDCYLVSKALDQADLLHRERGAGRGHHIGDAGLVHRDYVGIAFHQDALVLPGNAVLGLEDTVEGPALVVNLALGAVHIFGNALVCLERASAKSDHAPADGVDREDDPVEETVVQFPGPFAFQTQARIDQVFFLVTVFQGFRAKGQRTGSGIAQAELADRLVAELAFMEVAQADSFPYLRVPEDVGIKLLGIVGHHQQALVAHAVGDFLGRLFFFDDFNMVFFRQIAQRLDIGQVLVLHQEGHGITGFAAGEAFEDALGGRDAHRRVFVLMERT